MNEEPFFVYDEISEKRSKIIRDIVHELKTKPFKDYKKAKFLNNYIISILRAARSINVHKELPKTIMSQGPIVHHPMMHNQPSVNYIKPQPIQKRTFQEPKPILNNNQEFKPSQQNIQSVNIPEVIYKPKQKLDEDLIFPAYKSVHESMPQNIILTEPNTSLVKPNFILKVSKSNLGEDSVKILEVLETSIDTLDKLTDFDSSFQKALRRYNIKEKQIGKSLIKEELINSLSGFGKIKPLINDININSIYCQGSNMPVLVDYSNKGLIKTDLIFYDNLELNKIITNIALMASIELNDNNPIAQGILRNGFKFKITLGTSNTNPKFYIVK